ncbi:MAG TPA: hypothetical protein V6D08_14355 [Candidatus Obscuribacterales bacterium]
MKITSCAEAKMLLDESLRRKGFYQIAVVEALLEYAESLEREMSKCRGAGGVTSGAVESSTVPQRPEQASGE